MLCHGYGQSSSPYGWPPKFNQSAYNLIYNFDGEKHVTMIPCSNAYVTKRGKNGQEFVSETGLHGWNSPDSIFTLYFYSLGKTSFDLSIRADIPPDGISTFQLNMDGNVKNVTAAGNTWAIYKVGSFQVKSHGYYKIDIRGLTKTTAYFGDISHLIFEEYGDKSYIERLNGHRGAPGPVLWYQDVPGECEYLYQEIRVPANYDKTGTYYCANQFGVGYFGIQVNILLE